MQLMCLMLQRFNIGWWWLSLWLYEATPNHDVRILALPSVHKLSVEIWMGQRKRCRVLHTHPSVVSAGRIPVAKH